MNEVKLYRVVGKITKPNLKTIFKKEIRAIKPEHAVEEIYKIIGSKHRVKRFHIKVMSIEEISEKEIEQQSKLI